MPTLILKESDLTGYAIDLGIWDELCNQAGKPYGAEELTITYSLVEAT